MKRLLSILLAALSVLSVSAQQSKSEITPAGDSPRAEGVFAPGKNNINQETVNRTLSSLDTEIGNRQVYIARRQHQIDSLRHAADSSPRSGDRYLTALLDLGERYSSFNVDSALYYFNKGLAHSQEIHRDSLETIFRLRRIETLPVLGFIKEALEEFEQIDTLGMNNLMRREYEECGRQMNSYVASYYINYPSYHELYRQRTLDYQRNLLTLLDENSPKYKLNMGEYYYDHQEYSKAREILEQLLEQVPPTDNIYARAAHCLSAIAKVRGNRDEYIYYLTLSAISDVRTATLEVNSLQELGGVLYEQGDVDRAHQYLMTALEGAVKGHATMRLIQTAEGMPIIEAAHFEDMNRQRRRIYIVIGMLALLLLVLLVTVWFIRREMHRMVELQKRLETANHTKEVYISQFLSLCSIYMDKLHQFCKIANRKISAGQVDELYKMTKTGKFVEEQSREFYEVFDDAFLHIYPTFVESVNELLRPDQQIELPEGQKLNTDLRILAFMRLGIDDSSKIAQVLNYSVNTIYTYRNKLKNRAINRDTFESDILRISSIG